MKGVYPEKLTTFKKLILALGWISIFNLSFWIIVLIVNNLRAEEKFLNPYSRQILYIFGWIYFIGFVSFWGVVSLYLLLSILFGF